MLSELQQAPFVLLKERLLLAFLGLALALWGAGGGDDGDQLLPGLHRVIQRM